MRIFLIGMLCGVMITAAVTVVLAIPANNYQWRMEIWKRGGAAWTFDKNGHIGWKWMIEPKADASRQKPVTVPSSETSVHTEQL
jgi:gas vesicle protein